MMIITQFIDCLRNMEKVSKSILFAGAVCSGAVYLASVAVLLVYCAAFDDFTTGAYWYNMIAELSLRIFTAVYAPVFVFEIIYICRGLKTA